MSWVSALLRQRDKRPEPEPADVEQADSFAGIQARLMRQHASEAPRAQYLLARAAGARPRLPVRGEDGRYQRAPDDGQYHD
jgi:hypothetical protein